MEPTPQAPAPPPCAPAVVLVQPPHALTWRAFVLIVAFIAIIAFAAYTSGRAAKTALDREAAEANLVAQAGIPMALAAALT